MEAEQAQAEQLLLVDEVAEIGARAAIERGEFDSYKREALARLGAPSEVEETRVI